MLQQHFKLGVFACSLVSSTLAIPVVVFGAVSLLQQARQANEDKQLTLKAINTHNTFMSQEEAEPDQQGIAVPTTMLAHNSEGASTSSASGSQDSRDAPDAAAPAMLDQPDRPEPSLPKAGNSGADTPTEKRKPSELPPQTAVLDRPDRPEPDTASTKSNATAQGSDTAHVAKPQANTVRFAENQTSTRPHSPDTTQQVGYTNPAALSCWTHMQAHAQQVPAAYLSSAEIHPILSQLDQKLLMA